jgi:hypothetical protein
MLEGAVKRPIDRHTSMVCVLKHPQEPIFHRTPIEIFDNMENLQGGLLKISVTKPFGEKEISPSAANFHPTS